MALALHADQLLTQQMSCGAGQITRSVRVSEGRGGRNAMESDEPLGKTNASQKVFLFPRGERWRQSRRSEVPSIHCVNWLTPIAKASRPLRGTRLQCTDVHRPVLKIH